MRDLPVLGDRKPQDPGRPWWRTRFGRVRVLAARRQRRHGVGGGCAGGGSDGWRRRGCRVGRLGAMWRRCCFAMPGDKQRPLTAVRSRSAGSCVADSLALVIGRTGGGVRRGVLRRGHIGQTGASANTALVSGPPRRFLPAPPASCGGGGGHSAHLRRNRSIDKIPNNLILSAKESNFYHRESRRYSLPTIALETTTPAGHRWRELDAPL